MRPAFYVAVSTYLRNPTTGGRGVAPGAPATHAATARGSSDGPELQSSTAAPAVSEPGARRPAPEQATAKAGGWKSSRMVAHYAAAVAAEQGAVATYL